MSFKRLTISVPEEIAAKAQRAADAGHVQSVSAYFSQLAEREPDWSAAEQVLDEMVEEVGGISPEAEQWVDSVLGEGESSIECTA